MASSSSSSHDPAHASSSQSCKYDVFLSFRGEDTRKTFVDHLYSALEQHLIRVYKDDIALPRGESISPSLFEAIEESQIAVIVFSKNYADSSWCLEELAHIMKCNNERELIAIPIFYDVEPTEVRNQKGKFGEAFAKQEAKTRAEIWRKALVEVSNTSGWERKNIADGHESQFIKKIVDTILDRLFALNTCVDEDLVGMRARFHELESLLDIGSGGVSMVGIWGVGGGGKTTLATSFYMEISQHFQGRCIVENVREETKNRGLNKLQANILTTLFQTKVEVNSVVEGKHMMKHMLCRRKVLILLDDVDKLDQLEALAGKHNWFGSGSRIIITTRDEHLLRTHKVDHVYHIRLLSEDEAIQLFKKHSYNEEDPVEDYNTLSSHVVSYAVGLPLAIKVLGSFLYDKNKKEWTSTLDRLKEIPEMEIVEKLKISYDGLKTIEKELFLDIACFFRRTTKNKAMKIFEACDFYPEIGIKVLRQKALIMIVDGFFDMHDLVQELGHYIVRGEHPNNPKKHSRLWKHQEIEDMRFQDETMEQVNTEAIVIDSDYKGPIKHVPEMVSKMRKLRLLMVMQSGFVGSQFAREFEKGEGANFLSNELQYIEWSDYPPSPFPHSFQPMKLVVLKLRESKQKNLWKGCKYLPHLKVLKLIYMKKLVRTPDFDGLPHLQKLTLRSCEHLEEIHPSFENHTSLESLKILNCKMLKRIPTISQMKNIKDLVIRNCSLKDHMRSCGIGESSNLQELDPSSNKFSHFSQLTQLVKSVRFPCGIGELSKLQELDLSRNKVSRLDFSFLQLTQLKVLNVAFCHKLIELPELPSSCAILTAQGCKSLTPVEDFYKNCRRLCQVSFGDGWGDRLLQFMLKGNTMENDLMHLVLEGLEIPKAFAPWLVRGSSCRLELPENWCNDFSGFLICFVQDSSSPVLYVLNPTVIIMTQVSGKDFEDDEVWKERSCDQYTCLWYVSFDSLRHAAWWDQRYKALSFKLENYASWCSGVGVRLVEKKSRSGRMETSTNSSSHYTPRIEIQPHNSTSELMVSLVPYGWHDPEDKKWRK